MMSVTTNTIIRKTGSAAQARSWGISLNCGRADAGGGCPAVQARMCPTCMEVWGFGNKKVFHEMEVF